MFFLFLISFPQLAGVDKGETEIMVIVIMTCFVLLAVLDRGEIGVMRWTMISSDHDFLFFTSSIWEGEDYKREV